MNPTHEPKLCCADTDTPAEVVTPATILRGAATYLETHGWTQGRYYRAEEGFPAACVTGAIGMAAHGRLIQLPTSGSAPGARDFRLAYHYLRTYLIDQGDILADGDDWTTEPPNPFGWNDRDDQTAQTVIATLRAAADEYDWQHATQDDLETYADICAWNETRPDREGFLAWLARRADR